MFIVKTSYPKSDVFLTGRFVRVVLQLCNYLGAKQQDYGNNLNTEKGHNRCTAGRETRLLNLSF
jgi:hypothetical protein